MQLQFLGGISAQYDDGTPVQFPTRKSEALLVLLLLSPGLTLTRVRAAELLWGDRGEEQARASLRQELSNLRKLCVQGDCDVIEADRQALRLRPGGLSVDVLRFCEKAVDESVGDLVAAAAEYSGPLLDGFDARSEAFEEWLLQERQRLHVLAVDVFSRLVDAQLASGHTAEARHYAERLIAIDPLSEAAHRLLMRALDGVGDRSAALAQYDEMAKLLSENLGVEPAPETLALRRHLTGQRRLQGPLRKQKIRMIRSRVVRPSRYCRSGPAAWVTTTSFLPMA